MTSSAKETLSVDNAELQQVATWYDEAAQLDVGEEMPGCAARMSPRQLAYIMNRCMDDVVQNATDAGYRPPRTAHEIETFSKGYYMRLQENHSFTQKQLPRLLDALSSQWYSEVKTW
ncbi:hypothetical protein GII36_02000 [Candidatus Mycosynbacter amalyticus]|uniref:Uncharacterized protein n=1 Tax=Candidatus Mycosynbacter amalyticus TaxID=2665156 RepID=A0A857MM05_9BACT|nr:hypothetical protein [Candidatus Mycosynbacter amalyticus]QHN42622.1 hypothetical protein GII36_02000 [Candidatus Mycosynbacter amalyticus]